MNAGIALLDEVMPRCDARSAHDAWMPASTVAAFGAVQAVTVREVRLLVPLMAIRGLPSLVARRKGFRPTASAPVLEAAVDFGFVPLGERPGEEVAIGIVAKFWRLAGNRPVEIHAREDFVSFAEPGYAKAALGFSVRAERGGSRVLTETRVLGTSPDATRAFLRYWRLVRGGSGAIRGSWLAAIRRRAVGAPENLN